MLCVKTFCIGDNLGGLINIILIKYQRSSLIGKRVSYFLTRFRMNERMKITKIQFGSACFKLSSIFHFQVRHLLYILHGSILFFTLYSYFQ